ncbi:hypothetical protein GGQ22_01605 [Nocardioides sp. zg-579]|uniref:Uncharacterized protein n=1 Tax=Nocardioides marmotae TaxID=2663857 RepID=A0A6I3J791_9ACTN|nr:hypothetical protein [Nocardioides marmotae]MCR6030138.1 hypothetical protein [Gordonia jinghuaiqii]MTB93769.1 hypothetical protein [Nocardioides marmotae]QKE00106.1 hypothetical protein HPC71_02675 [Nocardioides marmotae]
MKGGGPMLMGTSTFVVDAAVEGATVLVDRSCGRCGTCRAGAGLWCSVPAAEGRSVSPRVPVAAAAALRAGVLAAAALLEAPRARTTLVVAEPGSPTAVLAGRMLDGLVLAAPSLTDEAVRAQVAEREPSGRAAVVMAGADVRSAVRAVRRGGHVCVVHASPDSRPSVTELVQREVTLLAPRQVTPVLDRLSEPDWAAAVAAVTAA